MSAGSERSPHAVHRSAVGLTTASADGGREPPPPPPPPPPRMLSQTLANYIAFPFPFAKKFRVRQPNRSRSSPAIGGVDRKPPAAPRRASAGGHDAKKPSLPASLLAGYVGEHWRKTPRGTFVPLSLVDCCIRSLCMRLIQDPESAMQPCENGNNSDACDADDVKPRVSVLPTELAAAILAWLKTHQQLEREQFQLLAPFLLHEWDLQGVSEVDESWFDGIPFAALQQLRSIDLSGCHELEHVVGVRRGSAGRSTDTFPSLTAASFRGCAKLSPSVVDLLQFSPLLLSLDLSGCRNVDDRNLLALRRLHALKSLNLSGCRLVTDSGVKHLAELHKLEKLVLGRCLKLTDAAFSAFASSYPKLRYLDIAHCRVSDASLRHIGAVRSLETLIVRGCNDTSDVGLSSLAGLSRLSYFDARHCEEIRALPNTWSELRVLLLARTAFGEADAAVLPHMPKLTELDVRTCRILKRGVEFICRLTHLERLVLAETALTDAGLLEICQHLKALKALDISSTEVTDAGTVGLAGLKDLEILNLDTSGITNRTLANLTSLPRLEKLDLFGANITDNGLLHLVPMRRLRELELCNGNISDRGVELISKITTLTSLNLSQNRNIHAKSLCFLRSLTELRHLNLSNTNISALSLRHLYPLKDLETLSVYGCALSASHIDVLRDILPGLRHLRCT